MSSRKNFINVKDRKRSIGDDVSIFKSTTPISAQCMKPVIAGAQASLGNMVGHGSFMIVTCLKGYNLTGGSKMTCRNGKFDQVPMCEGIILIDVHCNLCTFY